jgi:cytochrome b involved in lipid metabolism
MIVVGAGIAGLSIAAELGIPCFEATARAGGRIRSVYEEGVLQYEAGPWRVPETHRRVRALFRKHGIALAPLRTPTLPSPHLAQRQGLTTWGANALAHGPTVADRLDLETGYADETHSASGSAPYLTDAKRYFVAPEGFSSLVNAMAGKCDMRYNHRVQDVTREGGMYVVHLRRRDGHNAFTDLRINVDTIFVCVPPHACRDWKVFREHARSVMSSVETGALHHIYARARMPMGVHRRDASLAAQGVSSQYGNDWFQASYSAGRVARLWHNLRLTSPTEFTNRLQREVRRMWGRDLGKAETRSHHWPDAFHVWKAVPEFDLQRAVAHAVRPSPLLPGIFLAGEAFSSFQAWMEGALETAELALAAYRAPALPVLQGIEGWAIDVSRWARVHPGGASALHNHFGEDLTDLMNQVGHSDFAWAVAHSLKR